MERHFKPEDVLQAEELLKGALDATNTSLAGRYDVIELHDRLLDCKLAMEYALDIISKLKTKF